MANGALPASVDLGDGRSAPDFQRMAVAFDLRFPDINIGTIEPPSSIADVSTYRPLSSDWRRANADNNAV